MSSESLSKEVQITFEIIGKFSSIRSFKCIRTWPENGLECPGKYAYTFLTFVINTIPDSFLSFWSDECVEVSEENPSAFCRQRYWKGCINQEVSILVKRVVPIKLI